MRRRRTRVGCVPVSVAPFWPFGWRLAWLGLGRGVCLSAFWAFGWRFAWLGLARGVCLSAFWAFG